MFILYAVLIGLVLGFVLGGRLSGLATVDFRWPWLAIGGFVVQLVLFAEPVRSVVGDLGPPLYVVSTGAVLIAVIRNIRIPGMALVAVGAGANLAAIVANGGFMPASEAAFAALGSGLNAGYTNSSIVADPALEPLDRRVCTADVAAVRERLQHRRRLHRDRRRDRDREPRCVPGGWKSPVSRTQFRRLRSRRPPRARHDVRSGDGASCPQTDHGPERTTSRAAPIAARNGTFGCG